MIEKYLPLILGGIGAVLVLFVVSIFLPGIERKVQARIQQRIGPPITSPGLFASIKFFFKKRIVPNSPLPKAYNALPTVILLCILGIIIACLPEIMDLNAIACVIFIVGLLKIEEIIYVIMGALSNSVMGINHPFPDTIKGSKHVDTLKSSLEDISSSRAMRLITYGSFPIYIAMFIPVVMSKSIFFMDILVVQLNQPILFSIPGILGTIAFIVGMMIILNEYPFAFLKTKADVIEGPYMEYAANSRGVVYLTKGLLIMALTTVYCLLFLGIPPTLFSWTIIVNIIVAIIFTVIISFISAFSPVFTNKQFYPVSIAASIIGILGIVVAFI